MPYDTGMAQRLRDAGLKVAEVDGWRIRANNSGGNFYPRGFVVHHTAGAGPSAGKAPSLYICIYGRSDLSGPLCNLYMDYDGTIYTVAAGSANHAGYPDGGSYKGMTGNSSAWGIEIEHPGTYPLEPERAKLAQRAVAAIIRGTCDESMVCYHKEWTSKKPDLATSPSPAEFRAEVAKILQGKVEEDTMGYPPWFWDWIDWYMNTSRDPTKRPPEAPQKIPQWAWDAQKEIMDLSSRYGMTQGERDWISWLANNKKGERPAVPQTIPERWWPDNEYVVSSSK
jgi:N-acetylmuramoyl-L-alanine amidase